MGGAPNYAKGRAKMRQWESAKRHKTNQNIMVASGKGKYPKCLESKPYPEVCPQKVPEDPNNVPEECKFCPEHIESPFHAKLAFQRKMKRIKESGLSSVIKS